MLLKFEAVFSPVFCNFNKKSRPFILEKHLNSCYTTIHVAKFRWVLVEKIISGQCIFHHISLEKSVALHLNKIELSLPNYVLCHIILELD